MNLPGFTAETSLYRRGALFRASTFESEPASPAAGEITPQQTARRRRGWYCRNHIVFGNCQIICCDNLDTGEGWCEVVGPCSVV